MTRRRVLMFNLVGLAASLAIFFGLLSSMSSVPLIYSILGLYLIPFVILGLSLHTATIILEILTGQTIREYGRPEDHFLLRIHLDGINRFLKQRAESPLRQKRTWSSHSLLTHPLFILMVSLSGLAVMVYFVSNPSLAVHSVTLWLLVLGLPTIGALLGYAIFQLIAGSTR